jgi:ubiquinone/menaquinone biosynthesis C-methylase UbiE
MVLAAEEMKKPLLRPKGELRESIAAYDANADWFSQNYLKLDVAALRSIFLEHAKLSKGDLILDVGCGSGRDSRAFAEQGFRSIGVDLSWEMLRRARRFVATAADSCALVLGNVLQLPFGSRTFQGIWAMASLVHLPRQSLRTAFMELLRVSVEDGTIYVSLQEGRGSELVPGAHGTRRYFEKYTEAEVRSTVESASATIVRYWESPDPMRPTVRWINAVFRKR